MHIFWVCDSWPQMTLLVLGVCIKRFPQLSSNFSPDVILWLTYISSKSYHSYKTYNFLNSEQCGYSLPKLIAELVSASVVIIACIYAMLLLLL